MTQLQIVSSEQRLECAALLYANPMASRILLSPLIHQVIALQSNNRVNGVVGVVVKNKQVFIVVSGGTDLEKENLFNYLKRTYSTITWFCSPSECITHNPSQHGFHKSLGSDIAWVLNPC